MEKISSALGFSLNDLPLNRAGALSAEQLARCNWMAIELGGIALLAVATFAVAYHLVRPKGMRLLAFGLLAGTAISVFVTVAGSEVRAALAHEVETAEGPVRFEGAGRSAAIVIGAKKILVPGVASRVLTKGARYRVYYLRHSDAFLSIEPSVAGSGE